MIKFLKKVVFIIFIGHFIYILALKWIYPPITVTQLESYFSGEGLKKKYVNYNNISKEMKLAVIAAEDQQFANHNGFDFKSIKKVLEKNNHKKRLRGASTISQQTAKNVFFYGKEEVGLEKD